MIITPPNINYTEQTQQFKQNADSFLTRSAIILRREIEDLKPVVTLGVPAMGLIAFYSRNQAFVPKPDDKLAVRILKNTANKIGDIFVDTSKAIFNGIKNISKKTFIFFKDETCDCFSALAKSVGGAAKKSVKSLLDSGRDFFKHLL